ncbi:MAG: hypothetical protein AB7O80_02680 [Acetobacteraceae bacterium]
MSAAWLIVRATVPDVANRSAFDHWYRTEHLPDAMKAFGVSKAWRGWSQQDPSVHSAHYRFDSLDALGAVMNGPVIKDLIAEFDRVWGNKVTRTREVTPIADEVGV